jgi:hypothetical protein
LDNSADAHRLWLARLNQDPNNTCTRHTPRSMHDRCMIIYQWLCHPACPATAIYASDGSFPPPPPQPGLRTSYPHDLLVQSCRGHQPLSKSTEGDSIISQMFIGFLQITTNSIVCVGVVCVCVSSEIIDHLPNPADIQHLMIREVAGKYPPVLPKALADDVPGERKACLDLGCGSGEWYESWSNIFLVCSRPQDY